MKNLMEKLPRDDVRKLRSAVLANDTLRGTRRKIHLSHKLPPNISKGLWHYSPVIEEEKDTNVKHEKVTL